MERQNRDVAGDGQVRTSPAWGRTWVCQSSSQALTAPSTSVPCSIARWILSSPACGRETQQRERDETRPPVQKGRAGPQHEHGEQRRLLLQRHCTYVGRSRVEFE